MKPSFQLRAVALVALLAALVLSPNQAMAAGGPSKASGHAWCGTHDYRGRDALLTHELNAERLSSLGLKQGSTARVTDVGNISVVEDDGTLVWPENPWDIQNGTKVSFKPVGTTGFKVGRAKSAKFVTGGERISSWTGGGPGTPEDDGYAEVPFASGFQFTFYGQTYDRVFVGTNGFVTFGSGDFNSPIVISTAKLGSDEPRIALFWTDVDTTNASVEVKQSQKMVAITWNAVQIYNDFGSVGSNTFQLQLYKNGKIVLLYRDMSHPASLVGVSPGGDRQPLRRVDVTSPAKQPLEGALFENFAFTPRVDIPGLAQAFFQTHGDDYDFIYFWSDFFQDMEGALAYYTPVKNDVSGIGEGAYDFTRTYGSAGRLQGVLNMNRPDIYPDDTRQKFLALNDTLAIFGHEQGHRWLARVRFLDNGVVSNDLLGRQFAHWSFYFNTESTVSSAGERFSSLDQGNVIEDNGDGTFTTVTTSVGYFTELDQYLMGLRPASQVRDSFLARPSVGNLRNEHAVNGLTFQGARKTVSVADVIAAEGPRVPDVSTSQKEFRGAFVLLTQGGQAPSAETLAKFERIRSEYEAYFNQALEGRGTLSLSLVP